MMRVSCHFGTVNGKCEDLIQSFLFRIERSVVCYGLLLMLLSVAVLEIVHASSHQVAIVLLVVRL